MTHESLAGSVHEVVHDWTNPFQERMPSGVSGRRIAFLATDGVDQRELAQPWDALAKAGAALDLISTQAGEIQATRDDLNATRFAVDHVLSAVRAGDYDGLVVPGGTSPERLRTHAGAIAFVRAFMDADKPVGAIGHGVGMLIEADAVRGRSIAALPSLEPDIIKAGGLSADRAVEIDQRLVTSRVPDDLPAFCTRLLALFTAAIDERRLDHIVEQSFPASDPPPGPGAGR